MYAALRPLLFRLDPERAHALTLTLLRWASQLPGGARGLAGLFALEDPRLAVEAFGLRFKNRVGLAAGYDKNGVAARGLAALGFGHVELGTITRLAQDGNPRPRVHRVPEAEAVINAMGFPNLGVDRLLATRAAWGPAAAHTRLGLNLGKGKDTPLDRAAEDYCALVRAVAGHADYVAINISSPNTAGLRQLQAAAALGALLRAVTAARDELPRRVPLLVKVAPDLSPAELDAVAAEAEANGVDGLIATNTTTARAGVPEAARALPGGLSGAPLRARATAVVAHLAQRTRLPIIGVGGILSPSDAQAKLEAGATLVQLYTGLIYAGPGLVRRINDHLLQSPPRGGTAL